MLKHEVSALPTVWERISMLRQSSLDKLAPRMRAAVAAALLECEGKTVTVILHDGSEVTIELDVIVHETERSNELQEIYFKQGTTKARTALGSWHYYGLAIDFISLMFEWFTGPAARKRFPVKYDREKVCVAWFTAVGKIFEKHGLKWGGRWRKPDYPHVYWGRCKDSPSDVARSLVARGGRAAVWQAVGASLPS